jgi:hypothetical protein
VAFGAIAGDIAAGGPVLYATGETDCASATGRFCSDDSGTLHIGPIDPGTFRLFVDVFEGPYGRQWVGFNGGTGRFDLARVVKAETGKVVTIPPIKLDRAGAVEGLITGSAGQPVFALVQIGAQQPGIGGSIGVETTRTAGTDSRTSARTTGHRLSLTANTRRSGRAASPTVSWRPACGFGRARRPRSTFA